MKISKLLKCTLAAVCAAAVIAPASVVAAADENPNVGIYPGSFVHTLTSLKDGISDFAVDGDTYAFAVNHNVYVLSYDDNNDRILYSPYLHETQVTDLDYEGGELYFKASLTSYKLTYNFNDKSWSYAPEEHVFPESGEKWQHSAGGVTYSLYDTGELEYAENASRSQIAGTFKPFSLKLADDGSGRMFAVTADDTLCEIKDFEAQPVDISYTDFSATYNISTAGFNLGDKNTANSVTTATIIGSNDVYYTQINTMSTADKFEPFGVKTVKIPEGTQKFCIVLKTYGDASVIATKDGCFITLTSNLTSVETTELDNDWASNASGVKAAYAVDTVGVYSSPMTGEITKVATLKSGAENVVTVTGKVPASLIGREYYRISYPDEEGNTVTGFVPSSLLTVYSFASVDNTPTDTGFENYQDGTNVTSVIFAIVIVGLVIVAIIYLTIASGKKKKKNKKKNKDDAKDEGEKEKETE